MNSSKQEVSDSTTNNSKFSRTTNPSSSRQSWAGFKNPRIVRVSRTFGGKDRHSKVCTVRGLRDRRIRLSVPTAIQLYDLQDRLGLNQPSKVVDWLIDATKHEIDKLPPLQIPPASLSHFFNIEKAPYVEIDRDDFDAASLREKPRGIITTETVVHEKDKWSNSISSNEQEIQEGIGGNYVPLFSSQNLFQLGNQSSSLPMPFHNWEPNSNLSLAPFGNNYHSFLSQTEDCQQNHNNHNLPIVPPYMTNTSQLNHFHLLNSISSQHVLPNSHAPTLQLISSSFNRNNNSKGIINSQEAEDHDNQLLPHKCGGSGGS